MKTYISDEQLYSMELCIYNGIMVQVEWLDGEHISQMCHCTASKSWRRENRHNDWVYVQQRPERCHGMLNGRLMCKLQRLLKIELQDEDGAFVES
jgi:hypothetical protein